ncbi:MAG: hypothetical protein HKN56_09455 [Gammaproteobacteria bacterium]|nr:hypothetical protein [Gammaproteobacteria bacterium]
MSIGELTALAAAAEQDVARWQHRFAALLRGGVLSVPDVPGQEFALAAGAGVAGQSAAGQLVWLRQTLGKALRSGARVALDLADNGGHRAPGHWQTSLQLFRDELADAPGNLSCSVPLTMLDSAESIAAAGIPVCVRYSPQASPVLFKRFARGSYANPLIRPVLAGAVRPLSVLHGAERGQAAMPHALFEVRAGTAWLVLDVDMRKLGKPPQARRLLRYCLRFADNLIDAVNWPLATLRLDALLNRRVALRFTHVADLLARNHLQFGTTRSFLWLQRQLLFVRRCIVHESMLLARRRGPFPDLCAGDLMAALTPRYGVADARRLLRNRLLRHRHLFALSPASLLPINTEPANGGSVARDWLDLLPAMRHADAILFSGPDLRSTLSQSDWGRLLRLTAAVAAARVSSGEGRAALQEAKAGPL